eukprot:364204-Chlamydomonas_euryale.AAC.3
MYTHTSLSAAGAPLSKEARSGRFVAPAWPPPGEAQWAAPLHPQVLGLHGARALMAGGAETVGHNSFVGTALAVLREMFRLGMLHLAGPRTQQALDLVMQLLCSDQVGFNTCLDVFGDLGWLHGQLL